MKKILFFLSCLLVVSIPRVLAEEDYDDPEETQPQEEQEANESESSAVKGFAKGVKRVAYDGPKDFAKETASEAKKKPPIVNVVEGVNKGTEKLLDHTIRGAYKVATLGTSELESYEIQEPPKGSDEVTKIKISLPGT